MITTETRDLVLRRSGYRCEVSGKPIITGQVWECHHIYNRSEYSGIDRDSSWNLCALLPEYHKAEYGIQAVHGGNHEADRRLKARADRDKPKHLREGGRHPDLIRQAKSRSVARRKAVDAFKEKNGGLSPGQVEYRRKKQLMKQIIK